MKNLSIYLVGGSIRDRLLCILVYDRDWVIVGSNYKKVFKLGFSLVGKDFPVFLHPYTREEYALARKDFKVGLGYCGFSFDISDSITLLDDLYRRDLTINSIALNSKGEFCDPYNGLIDLKSKILTHVSDSFIEDPLRILRVARFYSKLNVFGFVLSIKTIFLIRKMLINESVLNLSSERVWQEILKVLKIDKFFNFVSALIKFNVFITLFSELFLFNFFSRQYKYYYNSDLFLKYNSLLLFSFFYNKLCLLFSFIFFLLVKNILIFNCFNFNFFFLNIFFILEKWCLHYKISIKYKKKLYFFIEFFCFYNKFLNIESNKFLCFLKKINFLKDKLMFIDYLLICEFFYKNINKSNSIYFYKYFFIDLVNIFIDMKFDFYLSNLSNLEIENIIRIKYLFFIDIIKKKYYDIFF